jgi:hypothetical protein
LLARWAAWATFVAHHNLTIRTWLTYALDPFIAWTSTFDAIENLSTQTYTFVAIENLVTRTFTFAAIENLSIRTFTFAVNQNRPRRTITTAVGVQNHARLTRYTIVLIPLISRKTTLIPLRCLALGDIEGQGESEQQGLHDGDGRGG